MGGSAHSESAAIIIVLWLITGGLMALFVLAGWSMRRVVLAASGWPTVTGKIISVKYLENGNGTYTPQVGYSYVVGGKGYASDRLNPGGTPFFYSRDKMLRILDPYAVGNPVDVRYNPAKPSRCAIELGETSHMRKFFGIMAIVAMAITIIVTVSLLGKG